MSIAAPHNEVPSQHREQDVLEAMQLLLSAPHSLIEKAARQNPQDPVAEALASLIHLQKSYTRSIDSLERALSSLPTTVAPGIARAVQATENLWRQVETEFGLLSSAEVAETLGASNANRAYASALRKRGKLAGIERKNSFLYPGFQLDPQKQQVRPWVAPLLELAKEHDRSESDALIWMLAPSNFFDGSRPADNLNDGERILAGAAGTWGTEW